MGSRTKTEQRPASRGDETEEEEEEAAAVVAAGAEPWVEAGPAANGKLFRFTDTYKQKQIKTNVEKAHPPTHARASNDAFKGPVWVRRTAERRNVMRVVQIWPNMVFYIRGPVWRSENQIAFGTALLHRFYLVTTRRSNFYK